MKITDILIGEIEIIGNILVLKEESDYDNQTQTNSVFGEKWTKVDKQGVVDNSIDFQKRWYLDLYGFSSEDDFPKDRCRPFWFVDLPEAVSPDRRRIRSRDPLPGRPARSLSAPAFECSFRFE